MGGFSAIPSDLLACSERNAGTVTDEEYHERLTSAQRRVIDHIVDAFPECDCNVGCVRRLLGRIDVEIKPDFSIERDQAPLWMPESSADPERLLCLLRAMVGAASKVR